MDDNHLTIGHRSGHTLQIFRSDGTLHPGHYNNGWNPFVGRPTLGAPNGVTVGNHAIQIGSHWRIAQMDARGSHLSIGHSGGQTAQIFRSDGTLHPGPRTDFNPFSRALGAPSGVTASSRYVQIGNFRIGVNDLFTAQNHLSVGHRSNTVIVYRNDGYMHGGSTGLGAHSPEWNPWRSNAELFG